MTKASGIGDNLYVGGVDLSGDVGIINSIHDSGALLAVTGIDKGAPERIPGLADGELNFTAFFNKGAAAEHLTLRNPGSGDKLASYCRGTTLGNAGAALVGKQGDYALARGADGSLAATVPIAGSNGDGLRWGRQLTAGKRTDTAATNGSSVDDAAATAFGLVAFLHAFAFAGTDVTVKIQDSANNIAWADLAAFTAITAAPVSERIAIATNAAVRRYLRAVTVTSAGFTSLTFAVLACRRYAAF